MTKEEAIEYLKRADVTVGQEIKTKTAEALEMAIKALEERKTGKWIKQNPMVDTEECSECGWNIVSEELETPYCPWCGAKMEGAEE